MRAVRAAVVQLSPVLYSREGTVDQVVQTIHEPGDGPRDGHRQYPSLPVAATALPL